MSGDSVRALSQRLAEKQASDAARIEEQTQLALQKHEKLLSELSADAQRGIAVDTEALRASIRQTTDSMRQASAELQKQTSETLGRHAEALETETENARARLRVLLRRSLVPLSLVWALALTGLCAALGASWWAWKAGQQVADLEARKAALAGLAGVEVIQHKGRTVIVAPNLSPVRQAADGRDFVDVE